MKIRRLEQIILEILVQRLMTWPKSPRPHPWLAIVDEIPAVIARASRQQASALDI
ncbi:MAG: hypothetical protein GX133_05895 [Syntrophomonadaceae bacterium]|nr:hypothetical protein [Syntrophomonadaceae bacterium]